MSEPNLLRFVASAAAPMGRGNLLERLGATMPDPGPAPVEARNATPLRPQGVGEIGRNYLAQMAGQAPSGVAANTVMGFAASPAAIRAFHGSPHRFDRFRMDRIGTGEGAQAYGYGLYFAGNEDVARSYRDTLSGGPQTTQFSIGARVPVVRRGQPVDYSPRAFDSQSIARSELQERLLMLEPELRRMPDNAARATAVRQTIADLASDPGAAPEAVRYWNSVTRGLDEGSTPLRYDWTQPGSMYEVNLRTDPSRLLDWDAPLSAQPQAVRDFLAQSNINPTGPNSRAPIGREVYVDTGAAARQPPGAPRLPIQANAARALREGGIDGIQYLDGGSRAAGQGTRNYVMFDDSLIDIVRRYGLLGLIGGGAAAGGAEAAAP